MPHKRGERRGRRSAAAEAERALKRARCDGAEVAQEASGGKGPSVDTATGTGPDCGTGSVGGGGEHKEEEEAGSQKVA